MRRLRLKLVHRHGGLLVEGLMDSIVCFPNFACQWNRLLLQS